MKRSIKVTPMDCFGTYMFRIDGWGPRSVRNHYIEQQSEFEDIRWQIGIAVNDLEAGELLYTVLNELYRSGYQAKIAIVCDDGETVYLRHDYFDDETIAQGDEDKWATVVCNAIGQYFHEAGDTLTVDGTQTMVSVACAMDPIRFNA